MIYRKFLTAVQAFVTAAICCCLPYNAHSSEDNSFTYTIINGEATITGFTGEPVYLEIPDSIEDSPVTQLRDNAFFRCTSLRQISLPQSIEKIGHHTFYECSSLESVVLPSGLTELGMGAFYGCSSLSAVTIPSSLTELPEDCFQSCTSLPEAVVPENTVIIGEDCFNGCTALTYISLGENIREIQNRAFYECSSLKSLYIPPSAKKIGLEAAGFSASGNITASGVDFTILGDSGSAAEKYALTNGFLFVRASEPLRITEKKTDNVKHIPLWVIILLSVGGLAFFILSCVIAFKQHRHEKLSAAENEKI